MFAALGPAVRSRAAQSTMFRRPLSPTARLVLPPPVIPRPRSLQRPVQLQHQPLPRIRFYSTRRRHPLEEPVLPQKATPGSSPKPSSSSWAFPADAVFSRLNPSSLRGVLFAFGLSLSAYMYYAHVTNVDAARWLRELGRGGSAPWGDFSSWVTGGGGESAPGGVSDGQMRAARRVAMGERLGWGFQWLEDKLGGLQNGVKEAVGRTYVMLAEGYLDLPEYNRAVVPIVAINTLVFLAWKIPSTRVLLFMTRHFLHHPLSGRSYTMLTSAFSHQSVLHFGFNMFALWSIGAAPWFAPTFRSQSDLAELPESTPRWHFYAFYISAALFSGLASHIVALRYSLPRLLRLGSLSGSATVKPILPGLGASGAIYSIFALSAFTFPEAKLNLIFLPFFDIPIGPGIAGLVAFDALGLVLGWRHFDHMVHLAGATFGALYFAYGQAWWERVRRWGIEHEKDEQTRTVLVPIKQALDGGR